MNQLSYQLLRKYWKTFAIFCSDISRPFSFVHCGQKKKKKKKLKRFGIIANVVNGSYEYLAKFLATYLNMCNFVVEERGGHFCSLWYFIFCNYSQCGKWLVHRNIQSNLANYLNMCNFVVEERGGHFCSLWHFFFL